MTLSPAAVVIQVSRRAAERLRSGHLWIYRSDVETMAAGEPTPGALLSLQDGRGSSLGTALWSTASQIAARVVSQEPGLDRKGFLAQVAERLRAAIRRRKALAPVTAEDNAHRLVFSEADGLPGIVADRYNDLILVQLLTQGMAREDVRAVLREVFGAHTAATGETLTLWERLDPRIRELEALDEPPPGPIFTTPTEGTEPPTRTTFRLNGLSFGYDAAAGQKTGAFLDQRLNYAAAAGWVERLLRAEGRPGRALDVCTYQGGFALHLARVCERVTGIDASRAALEAADRNLGLNGELPAGRSSGVDWVEADAFELLRALEDAARQALPGSHGRGRGFSAGLGAGTGAAGMAPLPAGLGGRFDAIVLDPPAFTKSKRAVEGALRGYKELNLRALRLLSPGGVLVTCSCSHHVGAEAFREAVSAAALDARRSVQVLEMRGAAPDHPELLAMPETRYLKCLICRVG